MKFEDMLVKISKLLYTPLSNMCSNTWIWLVLEILGEIFDSVLFFYLLYIQFSIESLIACDFSFFTQFQKNRIFLLFSDL